jgi:hypothetical protein
LTTLGYLVDRHCVSVVDREGQREDEMDQELHGPAETILQSLLTHTDHLYHNRPGMVVEDTRFKIGLRWAPVTHKVEDGAKVVYQLQKVGKKTRRTRVGVMQEGESPLGPRIVENGRLIGHYRPAGIFPEVALWMYTQIAEVWKMDNEFAARWASYAFGQEHDAAARAEEGLQPEDAPARA